MIRNDKLNSKHNFKFLLTIICSTILILSIFSLNTAAFSDYEKDVAEKLYTDLDQEYEIQEFDQNSLEFKTLKNLEKNITKRKFRNANFKLHHIKDELINAYYIGNGNIMLFDGLLQKLKTEDQLAALIAHEMGHAVEEHLTEDVERNMGLSVLNLLFNHFTDNQYQTITNIAQNLIANGYSREQEKESDIYAVDLMFNSGYNPDGLVELMQIFKENSNSVKLLEFTQTHPIPESRIAYLKDYISKQRAKEKAKESKTKNDNSLAANNSVSQTQTLPKEELASSKKVNQVKLSDLEQKFKKKFN